MQSRLKIQTSNAFDIRRVEIDQNDAINLTYFFFLDQIRILRAAGS